MPTYRGGRHEHGQNHLTDRAVISRICGLVAETDGPIIEIGAGHGALTEPLLRLDRPLTAVEIDAAAVKRLRRLDAPRLQIVHADFVTWRLPRRPHVVVGNLPFHLTTAMLRKLLHTPTWSRAVLLVQWEVARRRAGVGGASMMTAQWWPWVDFELHGRIPRHAFRPAPNVDGGLLTMTRRPKPLVPDSEREAYRRFVHSVFTGRGRGLAAIVAKATRTRDLRRVRTWIGRAGPKPDALPKDLDAAQWASLFGEIRRSRVGRDEVSRGRDG